jgi:hypothetical protein
MTVPLWSSSSPWSSLLSRCLPWIGTSGRSPSPATGRLTGPVRPSALAMTWHASLQAEAHQGHAGEDHEEPDELEGDE